MTVADISPATDVRITDRAARRVAEIAAAEGGNTWLRISVEGGGCSGFQYKFALEPSAAGDDHRIEHLGARVAIDPVSLAYLAGSEIDFVDELMGAAFRINNPNATASCGCGTSFSL
ncbi:MAG: hypothetical protein RL291_1810 [Pseudomonadota bacterium]|jgi:iron-sulfur cluster assembly accessory protein